MANAPVVAIADRRYFDKTSTRDTNQISDIIDKFHSLLHLNYIFGQNKVICWIQEQEDGKKTGKKYI